MNAHHGYCSQCKQVSLTLAVDSKGICKDCKKNGAYDPVSENLLPVWRDDNGTVRFDAPAELTTLREGEKLLIQMVSPYIPFVHIKNGTLGITGHVCSFPQKVRDVCTTLPRLPKDVECVKMIRKFRDTASGEFGLKAFTIRKKNVLEALSWLSKHNSIYKKEVTIDEANLDWMNGKEEAELPTHVFEDDCDLYASEAGDDFDARVDKGPAECQCMPQHEVESPFDNLKTTGLHVDDTIPTMSKDDAHVASVLKEASADWPNVSATPVSEYDTSERLFCKAFPWLFPGGVGDFNDYREKDIKVQNWAKRLLYYQDGRFAKDKMWSFFALNYVTRRRNQDEGRFFVNGFYKDVPSTLSELQEKVKSGDKTFLNMITYYSQRVKGSPGYWRGKRAQLYTWINYHVTNGNGMANFFITLSCAEYFWPDVIRLLNERLQLEGHPDAGKIDADSPKLVRLLDEYSIVVQEFFQHRVQSWLDTVGCAVFGIEHYFVRFEFAPSRGQIHAHLLAISKDKSFNLVMHKLKGNKEAQAEFLQQWSEKGFRHTAQVDTAVFNYLQMSNKDNPCRERFVEVMDKALDGTRLMKFCQNHQCSAYCLRSDCRKGGRNGAKCHGKRRTCRGGAGTERTAGSGDTPGFQLRSKPAIVYDTRGYDKIQLTRNHARVTQTAMDMLQSWRGNCDFQVLIYDSDPSNPDPTEIARVTDYIVAYTCKGNASLAQEKAEIRKIITR